MQTVVLIAAILGILGPIFTVLWFIGKFFISLDRKMDKVIEGQDAFMAVCTKLLERI